ncbi:MAG: hypothetical protein HY858_03100 [Candidatus Solibacter usitatus]|nr:hypothetical protein [Candidatus Solibacter usitatus]
MPLLLILVVQAALLFAVPDLLPVWTDELFTLQTIPRPLAEIVPVLQRDIHPPLYYFLLHWWPWHSLAGLRVVSGLWALAATLLMDWFWTRRWRPWRRWLALGLFAFSPCLLLYGRMARSYSMQAALALAVMAALWRWSRRGEGWRPAFGWSLALLYTHYVPAFAILGAFALTAWRRLGVRRVALFLGALGFAYLPWLLASSDALMRWGQAAGFASRYMLTGSQWTEQPVKIAFGAVSLSIGESFAAVSLLLVPLALYLAWRGAARGGGLALFVVLAGVIGYVGVARWVSYPFIPARLLWLLPFLTLAVAAGAKRRLWAVGLLLASSLASIVFYFRQENFLNKGYAAPLREIAAKLSAEAGPRDLILIDAYNTDGYAVTYYLPERVPALVVFAGGEQEVRERIASARNVWLVRNQRDISPGRVTTRVQEAACAGRSREDELLMPYSPWQQAVLRLLLDDPPTHFYQVTGCRLD